MTSLDQIMSQVETKYGKAKRTWVFDRGVVSEKKLEKIRECGGTYVVGTPRAQLKKVEADLLAQDWQKVRGQVEVKLRRGANADMYVIARSVKRRAKEQAIRRLRIRKIYDSLKQMAASVKTGHLRQYEVLMKRLGRLEERYVQVFGFVEISHGRKGEDIAYFSVKLKRADLKQAYRRDGIYQRLCARWQNAALPDASPHSIGTERFLCLAALSAQEKYLSGIPAWAPAWPNAKIVSAMPMRILR